MPDSELDFSDSPEITAERLQKARFVGPRWIQQFSVTAGEDVQQWFADAPEGRDEAIKAALREYIERHPRES
jgi:hypothetical protein